MKRMDTYPERYIKDQTCPATAAKLTGLFDKSDNELYGREEDINLLMNIAARVYSRGQSTEYNRGSCRVPPTGARQERHDFFCEAVFLSGGSGSGKSSLIKQVLSCCSTDWFVIYCKFDRQAPPLQSLWRSFDTFFGIFVQVQGPDGRGGGLRADAGRGRARRSALLVSARSISSTSQRSTLASSRSIDHPPASPTGTTSSSRTRTTQTQSPMATSSTPFATPSDRSGTRCWCCRRGRSRSR